VLASVGISDFGDIAPDELSIRIARALTGNLTEGGTASPREAAAFVYGYLMTRYIPARKSKRLLTGDQEKKVIQVALQFFPIAFTRSDAEAVAMVNKLGGGGVFDRLYNVMGSIFDSVGSTDVSVSWAGSTLKRAAAMITEAGEPAAAEKFAWGAAVDKAAARGVFGSAATVGESIVNVAAQAASSFTAPLATAEKVAAKGVDLLVNAAGDAKQAASDAARSVEDAAKGLKDAGVVEVHQLMDEAKGLAVKAASLPAEAKAAIAGEIDAIGAKIGGVIQDVKTSGTALQKELVNTFEDKFKGAMDFAKQARDAGAALGRSAATMAEAGIKRVEETGAGVKSAVQMAALGIGLIFVLVIVLLVATRRPAALTAFTPRLLPGS